jgi:hypothetical protein
MAMAKGKGKVALCVYVDRDVVEAAKAAGLNLSKTTENAFITAVEALSKIYTKKDGSFRQRFLPKKGVRCGRRDLNPRYERGRLES